MHILGMIFNHFAGSDHSKCPEEWCPRRKDEFYSPAFARGKYHDRYNDEIHAKAYENLLQELKEKFPEDQWERLHGEPRDQDNESLHSMASKRFSKATRPPGKDVFTGIIASVAGIKNWGRGYYIYRVLNVFGLVTNHHMLKLNRMQRKCIYNWHRSRSVSLRIKRAVAKKKYKERQQKRAQNRANNITKYQKNCDRLAGKKRKRDSETTNNSTSEPRQKKPRKKVTYDYKYACDKCGAQYKYEKRFNKHKCKK